MGYSQGNTGLSPISGINSQVSWNVNGGYQSHATFEFSASQLQEALFGPGELTPEQQAIQASLENLSPEERARQKIEHGIPLDPAERAAMEAQAEAGMMDAFANMGADVWAGLGYMFGGRNRADGSLMNDLFGRDFEKIHSIWDNLSEEDKRKIIALSSPTGQASDLNHIDGNKELDLYSLSHEQIDALLLNNEAADRHGINSHNWKIIRDLQNNIKSFLNIEKDIEFKDFQDAYGQLQKSKKHYTEASAWIRENGTEAQMAELDLYEHNSGEKTLTNKEYSEKMQILYESSLESFKAQKQAGSNVFIMTAYERETMREIIGSRVDTLKFVADTKIDARVAEARLNEIRHKAINNAGDFEYNANNVEQYFKARAMVIMHEFYHMKQYEKMQIESQAQTPDKTEEAFKRRLSQQRQEDIRHAGGIGNTYHLNHMRAETKQNLLNLSSTQLLTIAGKPYYQNERLYLEAAASAFARRYAIESFEKYRRKRK